MAKTIMSNKEYLEKRINEVIHELFQKRSDEIDIHLHLSIGEVPTISYSVKNEWIPTSRDTNDLKSYTPKHAEK